MLQTISESELVLMQIIWQMDGHALYSQIMEQLAASPEGAGWKKNTVLTLLSRLVEKGYLTTSKIGRRNEYAALVQQTDYQAAQTQSFVRRVYAGDAKNLICALLQQQAISPQEFQEIESFWASQEAPREAKRK